MRLRVIERAQVVGNASVLNVAKHMPTRRFGGDHGRRAGNGDAAVVRLRGTAIGLPMDVVDQILDQVQHKWLRRRHRSKMVWQSGRH
jgi:hypothetical protein